MTVEFVWARRSVLRCRPHRGLHVWIEEVLLNIVSIEASREGREAYLAEVLLLDH